MVVASLLLISLALAADDYNSSAIRGIGHNEKVSRSSEELLVCPEGTKAKMHADALRKRVEAWYGGPLERHGEQQLELESLPGRLNYPKKFLRPFQPAKVVVTMLVDERGDVSDAFVICTSSEYYEQSALEYAARFRFRPAMIDGIPVRASAHQPVVFDPTPLPAGR